MKKKITNKNNSSYVDSFFTYLTSQLKNFNNFNHGLDFYGSFLAIQNPFLIDIIDEIEYLYDSEYFRKNLDTLFSIDDTKISKNVLNNDSRNYKSKIKIVEDSSQILQLSDISDISEYEHIFSIDKYDNNNNELTNIYENNKLINKKTKSTNSTCSSRDSNTDCENSTDEEGDQDNMSNIDDDEI